MVKLYVYISPIFSCRVTYSDYVRHHTHYNDHYRVQIVQTYQGREGGQRLKQPTTALTATWYKRTKLEVNLANCHEFKSRQYYFYKAFHSTVGGDKAQVCPFLLATLVHSKKFMIYVIPLNIN